MEELALQAVRKAKAKKTHLTVPGSADADIKTLCGVSMAAGDYEIIDGPADCQPCNRKKSNRAFISSAYFAQDAGSRLLELSLQQTMGGRRTRTDAGHRPRLKIVEPKSAPTEHVPEPAAKKVTGTRTTSKSRAAGRTAAIEPGAEDRLSDDELRQLGIASLKRVGPTVYQSPAGALVRLKRQGHEWRFAEVVFDGPGTLTARSSGKTTYAVGDILVEEVNGILRLTAAAGRRLNRGG